jgi:hypothetical protein
VGQLSRACLCDNDMVLCLFPEAFKYQLRAYIYQARDLLAADESGLSGDWHEYLVLDCYVHTVIDHLNAPFFTYALLSDLQNN